MGRVEQKYLVLNAPASHAIDTDLRSLVDVWIIVQRRGFAHLYRVGYNQFADHELTKQIGTMSWNDINNDAPLRDVYDDLTSEKKRRLDGEDDDDAYLQRDEAKQMVEEAEREAKADQRNSVIERMADAGMTQADIAEYVDLSRSRVSQILSERRATRAVGD
jgi:antitoxin component HigA of HigAB toxin-antitoxin module